MPIVAARPDLLGPVSDVAGAIANGLRSILVLSGASLLASDAAPAHGKGIANYLGHIVGCWLTAAGLLGRGSGPAGAEPNGSWP